MQDVAFLFSSLLASAVSVKRWSSGEGHFERDRTRAFWRAGLTPDRQRPSCSPESCCARDCSTLAFGHIGLESTAFAPYYAATPIVALLCGWGMGTACATAGAVCAFAFFLLP